MSRVRFRVFHNSIPYDISFKQEDTISQLRLFILCVTGKLASEPLSSLVAKTERLKQTFLDNDAKNGKKYIINLSDMKDLSYAWVGPWDEHKIQEVVMPEPVRAVKKVEVVKVETVVAETIQEVEVDANIEVTVDQTPPAEQTPDQNQPDETAPEEPETEKTTIEEPEYEEPKPEVVESEVTVAEVPKLEQSEIVEPEVEEPKSEEQKPEELQAEEPKPEEPTHEEPKPEEPKPEVPEVEKSKLEPTTPPQTVEFRYPLTKSIKNVRVVGDFNNWQEAGAIVMTKNKKEKVLKGKIEITDTSTGQLQYKFIVTNMKGVVSWVCNDKLPKVENDGNFNNVFKFE